MNERVFIYGSGNMAWAIAKAFSDKGIPIAGISGRTATNVKELADKLGIDFVGDLHTATTEKDIVILAVKDDALPVLNETMKLKGRQVIHTAGSVELQAIKDISETVGVFYPMQRVIKFSEPSFQSAPICVEANSSALKTVLLEWANGLSNQVYELSSDQRKKLHLAAVFVSNFTTYMLSIGSDILKQNDLPSHILDSLTEATFDGLRTANASDKQTGPARRADIKIIGEHVKLLEKENQELADLYKLLSLGIVKRYNLDKGTEKN